MQCGLFISIGGAPGKRVFVAVTLAMRLCQPIGQLAVLYLSVRPRHINLARKGVANASVPGLQIIFNCAAEIRSNESGVRTAFCFGGGRRWTTPGVARAYTAAMGAGEVQCC